MNKAIESGPDPFIRAQCIGMFGVRNVLLPISQYFHRVTISKLVFIRSASNFLKRFVGSKR